MDEKEFMKAVTEMKRQAARREVRKKQIQNKKEKESKKKLPKHRGSSSSKPLEMFGDPIPGLPPNIVRHRDTEAKREFGNVKVPKDDFPTNEAEFEQILEEFEQHIRSEYPGAPSKKGIIDDSSSEESDMPGLGPQSEGEDEVETMMKYLMETEDDAVMVNRKKDELYEKLAGVKKLTSAAEAEYKAYTETLRSMKLKEKSQMRIDRYTRHLMAKEKTDWVLRMEEYEKNYRRGVVTTVNGIWDDQESEGDSTGRSSWMWKDESGDEWMYETADEGEIDMVSPYSNLRTTSDE